MPALRAAGYSVEVSPLFDKDYLAYKYAHGRASVRTVLSAFAWRLWMVLTVPRAAIVVVEYELLPWFPALLERWLAWRGCRFVVDYDDALFHQYDAHPHHWIRSLLGRKIATVMKLAHIVVAGNAYLSEYASRAGAQRVEIIPTVIDLTHYEMKPPSVDESEVFTIGWIGSPSTARYLLEIAPALKEVCKAGRARVCLVGSGMIDLPGVPTELITWSENTEVNEIRRFDVGIMPLLDEPWARGKCGFKLIQYMASGLPVVASPVGVNCEIVESGMNGYLASTTEEWVLALETLRADLKLRRLMGASGRKRVEEKYCLSVTAPRFVELLLACAA